MLSKNQFNRRMHKIEPWIWLNLQKIISHVFVQCNKAQKYVIDSFPVAACQNIRISRCKLYEKKYIEVTLF